MEVTYKILGNLGTFFEITCYSKRQNMTLGGACVVKMLFQLSKYSDSFTLWFTYVGRLWKEKYGKSNLIMSSS